MSDNPWMNQPDATPWPGYADPVANAEVQRLRAKLARVEARAAWMEDGQRLMFDLTPAEVAAFEAFAASLADPEETE